MALEFKIKDFAYPLSILRLRAALDKSQWLSREGLVAYQESLLRRIVDHAYRQVPYYRELFDGARLKPGDIRGLADLDKIPVLNKPTLRTSFEKLQAANKLRYRPRAVCTSGTTGERVRVLVDKPSNVLEFVYYWRHWNWAGYRLGDPFAEFSNAFFLRMVGGRGRVAHFQPFTNRLLLNSVAISEEAVETYAAAIRKYRPLFLKGLPSILYHFSLFLQKKGLDSISFKAVFSTGELLLPRQRKVIESTFRCKVYNSYGHVERTVAISECPEGALHINSDYGILELVGPDSAGLTTSNKNTSGRARFTAKILGTSLYNLSMPLLRYDVGDVVEVDEGSKECDCGRSFPVVSMVRGRQSDVIINPEGEVITAPFLLFEGAPEVIAGQVLQESHVELLVRILPSPRFSKNDEEGLKICLRTLVGPSMKVSFEYCSTPDQFKIGSGKFRAVASKIRWN